MLGASDSSVHLQWYVPVFHTRDSPLDKGACKYLLHRWWWWYFDDDHQTEAQKGDLHKIAQW